MTVVLDARRAVTAADPIVLPTPSPPARRPPLPIVATVVPIAAAAVMWLVTGSLLMLLFAALGPLIAVATIADGARAARRTRRSDAAEAAVARERARDELVSRHGDERSAAWAVLPDARALLQRPADVWRPAQARGEALVVGTGEGASDARVVGGAQDADTAALRATAGVLTGVPVAVPVRLGLCVVGPRVLALAVARALVLQLCLAHPPEALCLVGAPAYERWAKALPHTRAGARALRVALLGPGEQPPDDADVVIAAVAPGAPVPRRCGGVLTLSGATAGTLEHGADRREVAVAALSSAQAMAVAGSLATTSASSAATAEAVPLADVLRDRAAAVGRDTLEAPIGREKDATAVVDLVADGPHAVVAGVTGSGKSELLITWIAALCATRSPADVCFLLADFKGGTAFDALATLPHVTGVLTDLDGRGARRAMESLRAELRRREGELARVGARDIRDPAVALPRLVIVVDEFAAVLAEHPELQAVFSDIAARGRALGMHLVLGTQRITGVVRDALLANCPLRISLRVTDAADARAVIGTDEPARLPGDTAARGLAYVRRASDATPRLTRIALTDTADLERIARDCAGVDEPRAPWLPTLPARLPLADLRPTADVQAQGDLILGLADEPERQRQPLVRLVQGVDRGLSIVGGPASGKSTVLDLLAGQRQPERVVRVPAALEGAWDAVERLADEPVRGALVLLDDVDALCTRFPADYATEFAARLERVVRAAGAHGSTVVLTAQRLAGPVARLTELLPLRAVLPTASRLDFVAAGGDPARYDRSAPPGRAELNGRTVQFALPEESTRGRDAVRDAPPLWQPRGALSLVVCRGRAGVSAALAAAVPGHRIVQLDELSPSARAEDLDGPDPLVIVGDPDAWQRQWSLFARLRGAHDVILATSCAGEFRMLSGGRGLPPYADDDGTRAWVLAPAGTVARVRLPDAPRI